MTSITVTGKKANISYQFYHSIKFSTTFLTQDMFFYTYSFPSPWLGHLLVHWILFQSFSCYNQLSGLNDMYIVHVWLQCLLFQLKLVRDLKVISLEKYENIKIILVMSKFLRKYLINSLQIIKYYNFINGL